MGKEFSLLRKRLESDKKAFAPDDKGGRALREFVRLAALLEIDLATNGITEVDLAIDEVIKGGRSRI